MFARWAWVRVPVLRWRHRAVVALAGVAAGGLLGACSAAPAGPPARVPTPAPASPIDTRASATAPHIMILVMENESYSQIIGNRSAPFINALARTYLRATASYARAHDSLPNYLEMISGRAYQPSGTSGDCPPSSCGPITGADLAGQLDAAGIRWRAFMGAMPSDCDTSNAGGIGGYGVRHDPFVYFPQGRSGQECGNNVPATAMLAELRGQDPPDFVFESPSICDDGGYDAPCSTIANGDRFLRGLIPAVMATPWYRSGGTIILTWDEGTETDTSGHYGDGGGHVLTVVLSARTRGAGVHRGYLDTAGILRTVEHAYGLGYLGDAARSVSGSLPLGATGG